MVEGGKGLKAQNILQMGVSVAVIPPEILNKFEYCECGSQEKVLYYHDDEDKETCPLGVKNFLYCESCADKRLHRHL